MTAAVRCRWRAARASFHTGRPSALFDSLFGKRGSNASASHTSMSEKMLEQQGGLKREDTQSAAVQERMVKKLLDEGYKSEYLERISRTVSLDQQAKDLEEELLEEIAASLSRTDQKLNWTMLQMELAGHSFEKVRKAGQDTTEAIDDFNKARDNADTARTNLIIHRQACGFHIKNYTLVTQLYPIPARIRSAAEGIPCVKTEDLTLRHLNAVKRNEMLSWRRKKFTSAERFDYFALPSAQDRREYVAELCQTEGLFDDLQ